MGFNATRRYRDGRAADIALLVIGTLIIVGAVAWGAGLLG